MSRFRQASLAFLFGLAASAGLLELGLRTAAFLRPLPAAAASAGAEADFLVLCLGDSRTYGIGAAESESYPAQLENVLRARIGDGRTVHVVNAGYPGDNTRQMLDKLRFRLGPGRRKPDLVILMGGPANFWNFTGFDETGLNPLRFLRRRFRLLRLVWLLWQNLRPAPPPAPARDMERILNSALFTSMLTADLAAVRRALTPGTRLPEYDAAAIAPADYEYWIRKTEGPFEDADPEEFLKSAAYTLALLEASGDPTLVRKHSANLYLLMARVYNSRGRFDHACLACLEADRLSPHDSEIYQLLSMALFKKDRLALALNFSLRRLCLRPERDLFLLGNILARPQFKDSAVRIRKTIDEFSLPVAPRLRAVIEPDDPSAAIISWIEKDLRAMLELCRSARVPVFLLSDLHPPAADNRLPAIEAGLKEEFNVPRLRTYARLPHDRDLNEFLAGDRDHPNSRGYGFMAECIADEIAKAELVAPPPQEGGRS